MARGFGSGLLLAIMFAAGSPASPALASCNAVLDDGLVGTLFGQFATYFRSPDGRETDVKSEGYPEVMAARRLAGSEVHVKTCGHESPDGVGRADLILEKSPAQPGVFLHAASIRLWHAHPDAMWRWLYRGMLILRRSAIDDCGFESGATEITGDRLRALHGTGLKLWQPLCWNGLFTGYAAMIRQDLIDGSFDGKLEGRHGDNHLLVWIDIKAHVE